MITIQIQIVYQKTILHPPLSYSKISGVGIKSFPYIAYRMHAYHIVCVLKSTPVNKWPINGASLVL